MSLLSLFGISDAYAQAGQASQGGLMQMLPLLIIFFVVFYFLLIRPQQKQAKDHKELLSKVAKKDEVLTSGGILGRVQEVNDDFVMIEIANSVQIKVQKQAIVGQMPKGTIKEF